MKAMLNETLTAEFDKVAICDVESQLYERLADYNGVPQAQFREGVTDCLTQLYEMMYKVLN